jgi:hypothetical protein
MLNRPALGKAAAGFDVKDSELITVGRAYGQSEAALALAMLNASDIMVFAPSWYTASMAWHWTFAVGGIELRVPASQADHATEVLAGFQVAPCPKSASRRLLVALVGLIVLLWVGFSPPPSGFSVAALRPVPPRASLPSSLPS